MFEKKCIFAFLNYFYNMQNSRQINQDLYYVGASDRKLALFENIYPIPRGVSYNSYVLLDEKTVLLDTADAAVGAQFFENVAAVLNGRKLDYLVVNHMEPDHCALIEDLLLRHPEVTIVTNAKAANMIRQFFDVDIDSRLQTVGEGATLCTGRHTLTFVMAPMVHWPEAMVTYDTTDKVLFSADAFGTFGALNGNIYADEMDFDRDWMDDAKIRTGRTDDRGVYAEVEFSIPVVFPIGGLEYTVVRRVDMAF